MAVACLLLGLKACTDVDSKESNKGNKHEKWTPTEEDQCYIDSLWVIVNNTQMDVDTIKTHMDTIMIKLDQLHDE